MHERDDSIKFDFRWKYSEKNYVQMIFLRSLRIIKKKKKKKEQLFSCVSEFHIIIIMNNHRRCKTLKNATRIYIR